MRASRPCFGLLMLLALVASADPLLAQGHIKSHYTKHEHLVAMRDGAKLFTTVYAPKDTSRKYPLLLLRTQSGVLPYGPHEYKSDLGPSPLFAKEGYLMVQVQSTWFPLVDRNPQTFVEPAKAVEADSQKAVQRVYRTRETPSRVVGQALR